MFFKRKKKMTTIASPLRGTIILLENVPDPVFSQKMIGDGIAILPEEGALYAPVDGEIVQLFPTKHAIGIKTTDGAEILVHVGLETVQMKGEGFSAHVEVGQTVKTGDLLLEFSLERIEEKAASIATPIIITNIDEMNKIEILKSEGFVNIGEALVTVDIK